MNKIFVVCFLIFTFIGVGNGQEKSKNNIQTVSFCDLLSNPKEYEQKTIRVTAIFRYGYEWAELFCPDCENKERISIEFGESFKSLTKGKLRKKIKGNPDRGRTVKITAVGKLNTSGGYGHLGKYRCQMVVDYLETAEIILKDSPAILPDNLKDKTNCLVEINNER